MEELLRGGERGCVVRARHEGARADGPAQRGHLRGDAGRVDGGGARVLQAEPDHRDHLLDPRRRRHHPRHQRDRGRHGRHELRAAAQVPQHPRQDARRQEHRLHGGPAQDPRRHGLQGASFFYFN